MTVENMVSSRGNKVANQFVIRDEENGKTTFQSYESEIVTVDRKNKVITVFPEYDYSRTTGKYRNLFFKNYCYFPELTTLKGLEYYMNLGAIGNYEIVKKGF